MARINNVDVGVLEKVVEEFKADLSKAKKTKVIEGEWLLEEGSPQFRAEISYENGKTTFEADQPTNLGGGGNLPGPMHYCFYGLASCYTATFATMAGMLGRTEYDGTPSLSWQLLRRPLSRMELYLAKSLWPT